MTKSFRVSSPARIHFGLFAFGEKWERQYGGVGAMVSLPRVQLDVREAVSFQATGKAAGRVMAFATAWGKYYRLPLPPLQIHVEQLPRQHSGLGVGTQLGLCTAAACQAATGMKGIAAADWATSVGRGERSAIGTYGFLQGGLIAERGKTKEERISPLEVRCNLPESWRFLLIRRRGEGLSGTKERRAFLRLPSVAPQTRHRLVQLAHEGLIPAAIQADWQLFSDSLFEFSQLAGSCFAEVQGGDYNGESITELVRFLREIGLPGVGQTSWGPTVFALAVSQSHAEEKMMEITDRFEDVEIIVSAPDNRGVEVVANRLSQSCVPAPTTR
ncbi:MAG: hypothetical protein VB878_00700 [Pirellulaceae bacterium]